MPDVSLETILVAVIAGLGGGLAGTWLRIRHEREEAFRGRQITAADDLATGLQQAIIGLDDAYSTALKHGYVDAQSKITFRHPEIGQVPPGTGGARTGARANRRGACANGSRRASLWPCFRPRPERQGDAHPPRRHADGARCLAGPAALQRIGPHG